MTQSVLFASPYSGCRTFSGWAVTRPPQAPGAYWPAQRNAPGAVLSVDAYRPGWAGRRVFKRVLVPAREPPRATVTMSTPTQGGKFTIRGPSTAGPWTTFIGWDEKGTDEYGSASRGAGHNLGLG